MKILSFICCLLLCGCAQLKISGMGSPYNDKEVLEPVTQELTKKVLFSWENNPQTLADRNKYITAQLILFDIDYYSRISNMKNLRSAVFTGADFLSLSTGLASTVLTPVKTKTILSAITTATIGYRGVIDDNVFQQQSASAIISIMNTERKKVFLRILEGMKKEPRDYPFDLAKKELEEYAEAGSPEKAFAVIGEHARRDEAAVQADIDATVSGEKGSCKKLEIATDVYVIDCKK